MKATEKEYHRKQVIFSLKSILLVLMLILTFMLGAGSFFYSIHLAVKINSLFGFVVIAIGILLLLSGIKTIEVIMASLSKIEFNYISWCSRNGHRDKVLASIRLLKKKGLHEDDL